MTHRFSNHANKSSLLAVVDRVAIALATAATRAQLRTKIVTVAVLAALSISLIACGGSSTPAPTVTSVTVTASSSAIAVNGTLTFTPTVNGTGSPSQSVTWTCTGGTVSSTNVYTAPATAGNYTCTATSAANTSVSSTAIPVTVVGVSVSAPTTTVAANGTLTFTVTVAPPGESQAVTWTCTGGTVNNTTGVYTPPATPGNYTCTAASTAVTTATATTPTITVTAATATTVTVTAVSASIYATKTDQFTATVTPSGSPAATWSVQEGAAGGTITTGGLYTAPATAGTYHVVATSGTTKSTPFAVTVTIPAPTFTSVPSTTLAQATATYTYPITATDPAGTAITYALTPAVTGASISGSTLSWTTLLPITTDRVMPTSFTVKATTALGGTATQTWTVTPLRAVTVTYPDSFLSVGGAGAGPLQSIAALGAIVPGSATTCTSGGYTFTLCASSLANSSGTYTINNVPAGYYWLGNGPTERYWTNVNSFDGSTNFIGQLLSAPSTATPVDISGLTLDTTASPNVSATDAIWIGSPSTAAWFAPQNALPATGATFTDTTESIAPGSLPEINSGATGEPSWVLQFTSRSISGGAGTVGYVGMSIVADEYLGTGNSFTSTFAGSLSPSTPATLSFKTTNWGLLVPSNTYTLSGGTSAARLVYFGTYLASLPYTTAPMSAIGGGYPSCSSSTSVANTVPCTEVAGLVGWPNHSSQPDPALLSLPAEQNTREAGTDAGPLFLAFAALDSPTCSTSVTTLCTPPDGDTVSMPLDNAFASMGWPLVLSSQVEIQVPLGYTNNFSTLSTTQISVTNASLASAIVDQPVIYPVTAPTITWTGNTTPVSLYTHASPAPGMTLSWTAATLNSAISGGRISGYHVIVYAAPTSGAWGASLVDLYTTNTSLTVPTLGLPAGTYVFVIEAKADAGASLTASPWRSQYPRGTAQIVSAPMAVTGAW